MSATYFKALAFDADLGRTRGIDVTLKEFNLDSLLLPTDGAFVTWSLSETASVDKCMCSTGFTAGPAAVSGYPLVTSPYHFPLF